MNLKLFFFPFISLPCIIADLGKNGTEKLKSAPHTISNNVSTATRHDGHITAYDGHTTARDGHTTVNDGHNTVNDGHTTAHDGHTTAHVGHTTEHDGHATEHDGHTTEHDGHTTEHDGHTTEHDGHPTEHDGHTTEHDGHTTEHDGHTTEHDGHTTEHDGHPTEHDGHTTEHDGHTTEHDGHTTAHYVHTTTCFNEEGIHYGPNASWLYHPDKDYANLTYAHFKEMRYSSVYVDKTSFIKWVFSPSCAKYQVILAPSKFGKSVNFAMLREFLHPAHYGYSNGIKLRQEKLFQNLEIMEDKNFVAEHFMKHPIMYFDLSIFSLEPDTFQDDLADLMRRVCEPIRGMTWGKDYLDNATFGNITYRVDANWSRPSDGRALSYMYNQVYNEPVIVLVDGLNSLLSRSWVLESSIPGHLALVVEAIGAYLLEGLARNTGVAKILMTGRTRIGGNWTEFIKDLKYTDIFDDPELSSCYGFSETDMRHVGTQVYGITEYTLNGMKQWFDGYAVRGGSDIYCFSPVQKFFVDREYVPLSKYLEIPIWDLRLLRNFIRGMDVSLHGPFTIPFKNEINEDELWALGMYNLPTKREKNLEEGHLHIILQYFYEIGVYSKRDKNATHLTLEVANLQIELDLRRQIHTVEYIELFYKTPEHAQLLFIRALSSITSNNPNLFQTFAQSVHRLLTRSIFRTKGEMQVILFSAIQNNYKKKKICLVNVKVLGVKQRSINQEVGAKMNNFLSKKMAAQNIKLDILVITQHHVGILIGVEYGMKTSQSVLQDMINNEWYKAFYGDLCSKYIVQKMCFIGVVFYPSNNMTSITYLFNSLDASTAKTIRVSLPS